MPASLKGPSTRWIILGIVVLIFTYAWRQPYQRSPRAATQPTSKTLEEHVPPKVYDTDSSVGNIHPSTIEKPLDNPNAPSFPAFKTSADHLTSQLYNPYPDYNSGLWRRKWKGLHTACEGPRGVEVNGNAADMLKAYKLDATHTSPQPMFGSYDDTGLDSTFCFDRFARFDSYGYDEDVSDAASEIKREEKIDWEKVDWAKLQEDCLVKNQNRYESIERANHTGFWMPTKEDFIDADSVLYFPEETRGSGWWSSGASFKKRSAVVFHVEAGKEWTVDTLQYIRSVIQELSLHSGAEYEVIILVEIETAEQPNLDDPSVYRSLLRKSVPLEFIGNTLLFSRDLFEAWYPKVIKQSESNAEEMDITQALQLLSILRPDIEHFWQFEVDARYSGHHYQHLETISAWSKAQPRRLLWERSSRYFVPAVHGNWTAFSNMIQNRTADGGIWGPVPPKGIEPIGPDPPVSSPQLDDYHWGVGEDADFIAAAPIVDATGSGASEATSTNLAGTGQAPSRMTSLSIMTRFSKRLLRAMHHGQITSGSYMNPNKFPASIALHHGLKAVAFPLPIYLDYAKAPSDVEKEFNFNGGRDVYDAAQNFEEIGHRMTYFSSKDKQPSFADDLYKRWLGYGRDPNEKLCLPGILLHAINGV